MAGTPKTCLRIKQYSLRNPIPQRSPEITQLTPKDSPRPKFPPTNPTIFPRTPTVHRGPQKFPPRTPTFSLKTPKFQGRTWGGRHIDVEICCTFICVGNIRTYVSTKLKMQLMKSKFIVFYSSYGE